MKRFSPFGVFAGLLLLLPSYTPAAPAVTPGQPDTPEYRKAVELIRQLGNVRFTVREAAAKQLVELGRAAKPALLEAKDDADPEVADRCRKLLVQALALDFKVRLDAFLADKEGKLDHDIPGLERFERLVGKGQEQRTLFSEMLKTNQELFIALEQEPKSFPDRYAARCMEMTQIFYAPNPQGRSQPTPGDVAAMFFFGQDRDAAKATDNNRMIGNLLYQPAFQNALNNGPNVTVFRKLFLGWMEQRNDPNSISVCLSMIQQRKMKEGLPFAAKMLRTREIQPYLRAQAVTVLGQMGDRDVIGLIAGINRPVGALGGAALTQCHEAIALLKPGPIDDDTQVSNFNINGKTGIVQVRDIALAITIHLSGQKPADFGYEFIQNQQNVYQYYYLGFADDADKKVTADEKRAAARKKWEAFVPAPAKK